MVTPFKSLGQAIARAEELGGDYEVRFTTNGYLLVRGPSWPVHGSSGAVSFDQYQRWLADHDPE